MAAPGRDALAAQAAPEVLPAGAAIMCTEDQDSALPNQVPICLWTSTATPP